MKLKKIMMSLLISLFLNTMLELIKLFLIIFKTESVLLISTGKMNGLNLKLKNNKYFLIQIEPNFYKPKIFYRVSKKINPLYYKHINII